MPEPKPIDRILEAKMSRREFIAYMGVAALAVTGVTGLAKGLNELSHKHVESGYGASAYGGGTERIGQRL
jgi:hypothetical protein